MLVHNYSDIRFGVVYNTSTMEILRDRLSSYGGCIIDYSISNLIKTKVNVRVNV